MESPSSSGKSLGERAAELAKVFCDPTRTNIVELLMQNANGMTTMDICTRLGVLQPRVSAHLSILLDHEVVSVSDRGRQRVYTLVSRKFGSIVRSLASVSTFSHGEKSFPSPEALRHVRNNSEIRQCRTCYDHLAGIAGVELLQGMLKAGWLVTCARGRLEASDRRVYRLTRLGSTSLKERGVNIASAISSSRAFAYGCQDWTERRPHLGGSLGSAIFDSILLRGLVARNQGTRAVRMLRPISSWVKA